MTQNPKFPPNFRPRTSAPKDASSILSSALKHLHIEKKIEKYAAFPHWPEIVGPDIAAVAVPQRIIQDKILVVLVKDAVWAQELSLQKTEILEKLRGFDAGALIEDIRYTTGSPRDFE